MIALISVKWTWKCAVVNDSSDGPEMYYKVFIGRFPGFSKLLRASHHLKNHLGLMSDLQEHCCNIFCHVLTAGLVVMV